MSSKPVYERIIFNRDQQSVQGFTFEKESDISYTESYTYKKDSHDATKTIYNMFLYKNPGLKKFLNRGPRSRNFASDASNSKKHTATL